MLSDGRLRYRQSQNVLTPGTAHSYVQCPKSSMGASLFENNREEKNKILMFSQQCLTQILEGIQEDLKQYFCFLHLRYFADVAPLWQNLDDPEGALCLVHTLVNL